MRGKKIRLRALEPADLPLIYEWENCIDNWTVSNTTAPFSMHILEQFIQTSSQDIYVNRQLRLMVEEVATGRTVGMLDVFDFEPNHRRAGVGIFIEEKSRSKGYGLECLLIAKSYLFDIVKVNQIFCNIMANNQPSLRIFEKAGFEVCGLKKSWVLTRDGYVDEYMLQCFFEKDNN